MSILHFFILLLSTIVNETRADYLKSITAIKSNIKFKGTGFLDKPSAIITYTEEFKLNCLPKILYSGDFNKTVYVDENKVIFNFDNFNKTFDIFVKIEVLKLYGLDFSNAPFRIRLFFDSGILICDSYSCDFFNKPKLNKKYSPIKLVEEYYDKDCVTVLSMISYEDGEQDVYSVLDGTYKVKSNYNFEIIAEILNYYGKFPDNLNTIINNLNEKCNFFNLKCWNPKITFIFNFRPFKLFSIPVIDLQSNFDTLYLSNKFLAMKIVKHATFHRRKLEFFRNATLKDKIQKDLKLYGMSDKISLEFAVKTLYYLDHNANKFNEVKNQISLKGVSFYMFNFDSESNSIFNLFDQVLTTVPKKISNKDIIFMINSLKKLNSDINVCLDIVDNSKLEKIFSKHISDFIYESISVNNCCLNAECGGEKTESEGNALTTVWNKIKDKLSNGFDSKENQENEEVSEDYYSTISDYSSIAIVGISIAVIVLLLYVCCRCCSKPNIYKPVNQK